MGDQLKSLTNSIWNHILLPFTWKQLLKKCFSITYISIFCGHIILSSTRIFASSTLISTYINGQTDKSRNSTYGFGVNSSPFFLRTLKPQDKT